MASKKLTTRARMRSGLLNNVKYYPILGLTDGRKRSMPYRMSAIPWAIMAGSSLLADYMNPVPQPGEAGYTTMPVHHLRVMMENDSAFSHDCNYSHGTRIDYAHSLPNGDAWGLSFTQNIYTPETHTDGAVKGEHPYAGYLAVGAAYLLRGEHVGSTFELQVGCTGNQSGARYAQNSLHELCGIETWDGWHDQVPAEATVQLSMRQDYDIPWLAVNCGNGWQTDGIFFTREDVGTAFIRGGAGMSLRYGVNLPPSMQVNGNRGANYGLGLLDKPQYRRDETSYYLVGSAYVEYVARDITIDGGVFHHFEQTCSRQPWQLELQLGVGVTHGGVDYFAGGVYHSPTYREQNAEAFYGTFCATWHW